MKARIALLFGVFAVLLALFLLSQREESDRLTGEELKALGLVELPERRPVENLDLVDQNGNPFDGSALIGKWTFAFFGYTHCPDICPLTMTHLRQMERRLVESDDPASASLFQGMFVSVDPQRDEPNVVKEFLRTYSDRFLGVTGTPARIKQLADLVAVGYTRLTAEDSAQEYLVEHTGYIVIFSPDGSCYGFLKPPFDTTQLVRVFQQLERFAQP